MAISDTILSIAMIYSNLKIIGINNEANTTCKPNASPAYAPASASTCIARAAPMPWAAVPRAKPRAIQPWRVNGMRSRLKR